MCRPAIYVQTEVSQHVFEGSPWNVFAHGHQKTSKPVTNDLQCFSSRSSKSLTLDALSVISQELSEEWQ